MSHYTLKWNQQDRDYDVHYGFNDDLGYYIIIPETSSGSATPATFVSTRFTSINVQEYKNVLVSMNAPQEHLDALEQGEQF